jgi:hypothetical protein
MKTKIIPIFVFGISYCLLISCQNNNLSNTKPISFRAFQEQTSPDLVTESKIVQPTIGPTVFKSIENPKSKGTLKYPSEFVNSKTTNGSIRKTWSTFKDDSLIDNYIARKPIVFTIGGLKRTDLNQISSIDIMKALTEGTLIRYNGLHYSKNFIAGKDPNELEGPYGKLGNINSGGDNKNPFLDRPQDSVLDPILPDALKAHTSSSVAQVQELAGKDEVTQIRKIFFQARIPIYFWLANIKTEQDKVGSVMQLLKDNQLYDSSSTTFKLLVIDQINQMGPGLGEKAKSNGRLIGVSVVVDHMIEQKKVLKTKEDVLNHFVKLKIVDNNKIFVSATGDSIDLKVIPEELLRFFLARTTYFSANGPLDDFELVSNAQWLKNVGDSPIKGALHDILRRGTQVPLTREDFDKLDQEKIRLFDELSKSFNMD